ncbi:hypothetical protein GGTG_03870 [Gaeumannomyces tritici R3-111a-1]|uniref:Uncharacterized protein n=1 Tax=Gaeumannomyces tritici (strain R3-111a-1) TaxID=644352 RepID=J3NRG6_GAET3|nr:hypothetical protein GGTG_03870 [Gaeumannomyces tritici R3-111a-1]EJT78772.1 hypothetical protein GGTG_03870 [Gaeumannomyces tritici R3-111a-1]
MNCRYQLFSSRETAKTIDAAHASFFFFFFSSCVMSSRTTATTWMELKTLGLGPGAGAIGSGPKQRESQAVYTTADTRKPGRAGCSAD